jgi:hypothetical protein
MKMPKEKAQALMFEALFKHDGDREAAAKEMGISPRTFYRYLSKLDMYPILDRLGWTQNAGPPRGEPKGSTVVRARILVHIAKNNGFIDYGQLAEEIYGEDTPNHRQRLYSALEDMKKRGRVGFDGIRWSVLAEAC